MSSSDAFAVITPVGLKPGGTISLELPPSSVLKYPQFLRRQQRHPDGGIMR